MGMVPIPAIPPLTLARAEEPVLKPAVPIARLTLNSSNSRQDADETYTPSEEQSAQQEGAESQPESEPATPPDSTHKVNIFA